MPLQVCGVLNALSSGNKSVTRFRAALPRRFLRHAILPDVRCRQSSSGSGLCNTCGRKGDKRLWRGTVNVARASGICSRDRRAYRSSGRLGFRAGCRGCRWSGMLTIGSVLKQPQFGGCQDFGKKENPDPSGGNSMSSLSWSVASRYCP